MSKKGRQVFEEKIDGYTLSCRLGVTHPSDATDQTAMGGGEM